MPKILLSETLSLKTAIKKNILGQALAYQECKVLALMGLGGKSVGKGEVEAAIVTSHYPLSSQLIH